MFIIYLQISTIGISSTKINSLISINNFTYSELDQVLRIFLELCNISNKNKKNSLKFCSIDFLPCSNSHFPPFIFFHYRIELIRRNERPMNGSLITKACQMQGTKRRPTPRNVASLHGFNFSMYYITLISLRASRMHPVSNTLIIRYDRAVSVNSCYLYVTTSICGARAFIRVYRTKHP